MARFLLLFQIDIKIYHMHRLQRVKRHMGQSAAAEQHLTIDRIAHDSPRPVQNLNQNVPALVLGAGAKSQC
jgi:hypothetical protein